jgi:hypothetical protein
MEHELLLPRWDALLLMQTLTLQAVRFECWPASESSEEPLVFVRVARSDAWRTRGFEDHRSHPRPFVDPRKP